MRPELQAQIDKTIEILLPLEDNRWVIYERCKKDMRHYEKENKVPFNPQEWKEYIDYNKRNCKENNLVSLCIQCHTRANHNRDFWKRNFLEALKQNVRFIVG